MQASPRGKKEKDNPLQKLGFMMMMAPFVMQVSYLLFSLFTFPARKNKIKPVFFFQILSLPGAIAIIKISLLRSIMVAQLAIAIMIYNLIRSSQNSDVVIVHQPYPHTHYNYRHNYHHDDEDEWFGR